jgi:hypothetical protein
VGCLKERIHSEHEQNSCTTTQGKEEDRKGCLMGHVFDSLPGCGLTRKMQAVIAT